MPDGRPLSSSLSVTVAGPVGVSGAEARIEEGVGAVLAFAVTLSRAASRTVPVDVTSDGSAQASGGLHSEERDADVRGRRVGEDGEDGRGGGARRRALRGSGDADAVERVGGWRDGEATGTIECECGS